MTDQNMTSRPVAKGSLVEQSEGKIVFGIPGTEYQIHLLSEIAVTASSTGKIAGTITVRAQRIDKPQNGTGGRYIEPVYGRPRRIQGRIVELDTQANTITVTSACPMVVTFTTNQTVNDFQVGELVMFDVEPGATFKQV